MPHFICNHSCRVHTYVWLQSRRPSLHVECFDCTTGLRVRSCMCTVACAQWPPFSPLSTRAQCSCLFALLPPSPALPKLPLYTNFQVDLTYKLLCHCVGVRVSAARWAGSCSTRTTSATHSFCMRPVCRIGGRRAVADWTKQAKWKGGQWLMPTAPLCCLLIVQLPRRSSPMGMCASAPTEEADANEVSDRQHQCSNEVDMGRCTLVCSCCTCQLAHLPARCIEPPVTRM